METLGLHLPNSLPLSSLNSLCQSANYLAISNHGRSFLINPHKLKSAIIVRAVAGDEEEEVKQAKEMAAARRRWETLIREQKIKVLTPKEAGYAIQLSNKSLLDVRPSTEYNKAKVKGSAWVPIFDIEKSADVGALSRRTTNFVMGGWWSGSPTLSYDKNFISKVEEMFPKDTDLIVMCQKGLRSLAACEQLHNAGYRNLFWVQGGLEAAEEEDFQREGAQPFKLAGIGGVSEFFGWTDQQRAFAAKEGWGYRLVFTGRLIGAIVLADALFFGAQQFGPLLRELRSH
ncbi:rhodanese-like domain-containing protein 11, chloroplastic isoform X2 [Asparagus officinalis]|uniref:rhodanese-like domain-containing protein 11, chloroplastic isoform X1 n=1 Tax=Asparagus officinalis TaxID=4686 RepID=UPI00098E6DF3|nr:rhodanese-like domain-containing protein 11, chloroplastic isoform X1 [Asparagus officinalis]XP_020246242.1 rhodanese-like domain-containing protein 11, chloroplastic isoform X2 [Asparagus officinalis]